jgi:parallel beta-helix repeat protein
MKYFLCVFLIVSILLNIISKEIKVPENTKTIQDAINKSVYGDIIIVSAGIYHENLILKKGITIDGQNPVLTIIQGNGNSDVILCADNCTIMNFTISNSGQNYFGIKCVNSLSTIKSNIIFKNGNGIYLSNSNTIIEGNLILKNDNGTDYGGYSIFCKSGKPIIINNTIADNYSVSGINCDNSNPLIKYNIIVYNLGGINCLNGSKPELLSNDVWSNSLYGNYKGCTPDSKSISLDPLFIDRLKGDFQLLKESPCLKNKTTIGSSGYKIIHY